jgi:hypothetical protein
MDKLSLINFDSKYISNFVKLNLDWLEKYFIVEPYDKILLENCQEEIINKGGFIFFGINNSTDVIGTVALIKKKDGVFEMAKMAVDPLFQ